MTARRLSVHTFEVTGSAGSATGNILIPLDMAKLEGFTLRGVTSSGTLNASVYGYYHGADTSSTAAADRATLTFTTVNTWVRVAETISSGSTTVIDPEGAGGFAALKVEVSSADAGTGTVILIQRYI